MFYSLQQIIRPTLKDFSVIDNLVESSALSRLKQMREQLFDAMKGAVNN